MVAAGAGDPRAGAEGEGAADHRGPVDDRGRPGWCAPPPLRSETSHLTPKIGN